MKALETLATVGDEVLAPTAGWNTVLRHYRRADTVGVFTYDRAAKLTALGSIVAATHAAVYEGIEGLEKTRDSFVEAAQPPMELGERLAFENGFKLLESAVTTVVGAEQ